MDTLLYVKRLEAIGISRPQAEAQVEFMSDVINENLATKQDLANLEGRLRSEIKEQVTELRTEMNTRFLTVEHNMGRLEDRLTIKLGTIMVIGIGALATLMKFLN